MTGVGRDSSARRAPFVALGLALCLLAAGFAALGIWQVKRLSWKNDLVAAVQERSTAAPIDLAAADWTTLDGETDAYRRASVAGRFAGPDTLVQAVTSRGGGFWALTPLALADGRTILVNRGFVPRETAPSPSAYAPSGETVTVTGLLRATEPDGGFLRANDPAAERWYSRDVAAIAGAQDLARVAPMFLDADFRGETAPVGGLTVLTFSNNHLVYALTWFALAALSLGGFAYLGVDRRRGRWTTKDGAERRADAPSGKPA